MDHLISVIVPVYNVEKYLNHCVNSIIFQTYKNLDIILVNDGSTDESPSVCDELVSRDFRIRVIHKSNGGLSSARNAGLDMAKGEFIGFVDGDDFIENDMYEKLLEACISDNVTLSICGRYDYHENGSKASIFTLPQHEVWSGKQAISNLLVWNKIDSSACNKLFSKELFNDIRFPIGKICEDVYIIPEIICKCAFVTHIGEAKYFYHQRPGSISHSRFSLNRMNMLDAHKDVSDFVKKKFPDLHNRADNFYFHAFLCLYLDFYSTEAFNQYLNVKEIVDKSARINFFSILTNRYVHIRDKIFFTLIYLKIYSSLKNIKTLLQKLFFNRSFHY